MKSKQVQDNLKRAMLDKYGVENAYQSETIKKKIQDTNMKRYGAKNPQQSDVIHNKTLQTNMERYGTASPLACKDVREKLKSTNLKKYGAESPLGSGMIREKIENTNIERYGFKNPMMSNEVQEKTRQTTLERYGVENVLMLDEFRSSIKSTCIERYGVDAPLKSSEIYQKTRDSIMLKYGVEHFNQSAEFVHRQFEKLKERWKDFVVPLFDESEYDGLRSDKPLKWRCVKCGREFEHSLKTNHVPLSITNYSYIPRCKHCYPHSFVSSAQELEIYEFCKQYASDAVRNDLQLIGIDLDVLIPSKKLAVEFNGVYYHSTKFKRRGIHLSKTEMCNEKGYRLLHIWEDDWIYDKGSVLERLKKVLLGKEDLSFNDDVIVLDRSWYNGVSIPGYCIANYTEPSIVVRYDKFEVEDCGEIILKKI